MVSLMQNENSGPDFLKMIDQIWSIIDSRKKSIELKIVGKKIDYWLIEKKNWLLINQKKKKIRTTP